MAAGGGGGAQGQGAECALLVQEYKYSRSSAYKITNADAAALAVPSVPLRRLQAVSLLALLVQEYKY